jgi:hypothetical protein
MRAYVLGPYPKYLTFKSVSEKTCTYFNCHGFILPGNDQYLDITTLRHDLAGQSRTWTSLVFRAQTSYASHQRYTILTMIFTFEAG